MCWRLRASLLFLPLPNLTVVLNFMQYIISSIICIGPAGPKYKHKMFCSDIAESLWFYAKKSGFCSTCSQCWLLQKHNSRWLPFQTSPASSYIWVCFPFKRNTEMKKANLHERVISMHIVPAPLSFWLLSLSLPLSFLPFLPPFINKTSISTISTINGAWGDSLVYEVLAWGPEFRSLHLCKHLGIV